MSVRSRTASTSSERIRPAIPWRSFLRVRSLRLQQPTLGKEELLVGPEGEPVGHPRDVVGDLRGQVAWDGPVLGRHGLRVLKVVREQRSDQLHRLFLLGPSLGTQVDAAKQEVSEQVERFEDRSGEPNLFGSLAFDNEVGDERVYSCAV